MTILSIDIGGTFIKYGLVKNGEILEKGEIATPKDTADNFYNTLVQLIEERKEKVEGVAISIPGFIDPDTQIATKAGALTYLDGHCISKDIEERLDFTIPIHTENDANCVAIAEKLAGNAKDVHDFIVVTLGTGIGGAIYVNNQLLRGKRFAAGEFGMQITDYSKHKFATMHEFGSTQALINEYAKLKKIPAEDIAGYQVMSQLDQKDVKKLVNDWSMRVAILLYNLIVTLDPQRILIGGGISKNEFILPMIKKSLSKILNYKDFETDIMNCKFYNDAGLLGAYWAFEDQVRAKKKA